MQLQRRKQELDRLDIRVLIITFDAKWLAERYAAESKLPWPLLLDSERRLYQGYGMTQATWWELLKPSAIWKYLLLIFRGILPGRPGADVQQLGGDVLIDPSGKIRYLYRSLGPHDRPKIDALLAVVAQAE